MNPLAGSQEGSLAVIRGIINITNLNEEQLLLMLQNCVSSMTAFASRTRNVHREFKKNLEKTGKFTLREG